MIPWDHDFVSYGDSSLFAAGVYSIELNFWWHVEWPVNIQKKTFKYFQYSYKDASTGELIFINLLEYVAAILNYAAASVRFHENSSTGSTTSPFPVLLKFSDNESINSWIRKTPFATAKYRALSRLFTFE